MDPVMTLLRYFHLDVFAASHGGGNHLGVVIGADHWSAEAMQRFARWNNLVETTYLLPPTSPQASYRVRMFTPEKEIAFAGHPSVGSAHAVLEAGLAAPRDGLLWQECGAGILPIRVQGDGEARQLLLKSPPAQIVEAPAGIAPLLAAALAGGGTGVLPPGLVEGGRRWWVAECTDEATLRGWQPDHAAIRALALASDSMGVCAFARSAGRPYELAVRAFASGAGIVEDPASGAANGLLAAYLARREPQGPLARGYRVSQGREMGYDAQLLVRIDGDEVWVGGRTHSVVDGSLRWPVEA
jgi:PhzF family phenazine biosynthesis protein